MRQDSPALPDDSKSDREIELKFLTSESGFKASRQWPPLAAAPPGAAHRLVTRYFDTANGDLERNCMVLRMRKQGRRHTLSLKWRRPSDGGIFERGEIEAISPGPAPDPALLGPDYAAMVEDVVRGQPLVPVYETDIRRAVSRITANASDIEVALDSGFIQAGEKKSPVREIELELKSGDPAELYRIGMSLAESCPVRLGMQPKAVRGAALRSGKAPAAVRGISPLVGNPTVDEAIGHVINACIAQFTGNFPVFEAGDAVAAVHQMRVAIRRLRAILKAFGRSFPCAEFHTFRARAKRIAAVLGNGRDWDVFLQLLRDGPMPAFPEEKGFAPIIAAAERARAAAYQAIDDMLAAPATTCFVLSMQSFVAQHGWRNALNAEALPRLSAPAAEFATGHLHRLRAKLLKRGKHIERLVPRERHKLRIGLKELRYTADPFSGLFRGSKTFSALLRHCARLQDLLGGYNDHIVAMDLLRRLETGDEAVYASGIFAGWCRRGAMSDGDDALRRAWKKFR